MATSCRDGMTSWPGHSNVRQESVVKHFLYNRLQSLLDRKLIERDGQRYRLARRGEDYNASLISGLPDAGQSRVRELLATVEAFNRSQQDMLRERLENMDPFAFERLICDLLTEMGYEDVEVTQPTDWATALTSTPLSFVGCVTSTSS